MKNRVATFLIFLMLAALTTSSGSCVYVCDGISGNGHVVKQERAVGSFSSMEVGGAFEVVLIQGDHESLVVEADENLIETIITEVRGNNLVIETEKNLRKYEILKVTVTFRELRSISLSGAVDVRSEGKLTFSDLFVEASGATEIDLEMEASALEVELSGASEITFAGYSRELKIESSGASELNAENLETESTTLEISGAGDASVFVNSSLDINVSGAASVKYKGNPETINQSSSGAGSIRKID